MNKFELICEYCGYSWGINYTPKERVYCTKCRDSNIRVVDIARERINYYEGSPPFKEEEETEWNR